VGTCSILARNIFRNSKHLSLRTTTRASVERCTSLVPKALKAIYQRNGDQMCS
jgi:hypothetical protein